MKSRVYFGLLAALVNGLLWVAIYIIGGTAFAADLLGPYRDTVLLAAIDIWETLNHPVELIAGWWMRDHSSPYIESYSQLVTELLYVLLTLLWSFIAVYALLSIFDRLIGGRRSDNVSR